MSPKQGVRNPPSKEEGLQELKNLIEGYEHNLEISKKVDISNAHKFIWSKR